MRVGLHIDWTLLHSCTCVSLVAELLCALDHSSNLKTVVCVCVEGEGCVWWLCGVGVGGVEDLYCAKYNLQLESMAGAANLPLGNASVLR